MTSYFIETHGCSLNQSDSEFMEGRLAESGWERAESAESADIVILNTCTVKDRTYYNFLNRLAFYEHLRRQNEPKGKPVLLIAGCIPRAMPEDAHLSDYSLIGPNAIGEIAEAAKEALRGGKARRLDADGDFSRLNQPARRQNPVIEILPISRGCLGECAYCQTRLARGRLVSYSMEDILNRLRRALDEGVKEIWLTAQDAGAWGLDAGNTLPKLLGAISALEGDFRVRIGMANPNHILPILEPLLDAFNDRRFFRFLHLPLQSGSDRVLKLMNRAYSVGDYYKICEAIYSRDSEFSIATDVIAGFPGETEDDFLGTLEALERTRPAVVNRSKFGARPKTPAALMPQHRASIITERSARLSKQVERISLENNRRWVGRRCRVLIDIAKRKGSVISRNDYYKSIIISHEGRSAEEVARLSPGFFCRVELVEASTYHLIGNPFPAL
ncbi:MAG: (Dimethylallyl)adenosine tRNA methylthiotransferase MiaB [candidate division BRC1 bacterium ADurb.Bin183]|nr:MAG: (Dimethylallyl)adenosine tRNA methylthiotransferase MiaB [candidate division BRC1 bacterium ADurb.Bin183]